jgi:hypothetical protein
MPLPSSLLEKYVTFAQRSWGADMTENVGVANPVTANRPAVPEPVRRRLQAFAFDPMSTRLSGRRLNLDTRFERVTPGPVGELIHVVDYDVTRDRWYRPVEMDG